MSARPHCQRRHHRREFHRHDDDRCRHSRRGTTSPRTAPGRWCSPAPTPTRGPTSVSGGTLLVNGSVASSSLTTVGSGAFLGGTGIVGETQVMAGGTLSPGNSIGTLTVDGNLTFHGSSFYRVEVSPSAADRTDVTGTATLAGTVQAAFQSGALSGAQLHHPDLGGPLRHVRGLQEPRTCRRVSRRRSTMTAATCCCSSTARLEPERHGLPPGAFSANQRNVAQNANGYFNNGGALPPSFVSLFGLTGGTLGHALSQAAGEPGAGGGQSSFLAMNQFLGAMFDPFATGRGGFGGGFSGGGASAYAAEPERSRDGAGGPCGVRPILQGADESGAGLSGLRAALERLGLGLWRGGARSAATRPAARTTPRTAPMASRSAPTTTCRPTPGSASHWPAAAPTSGFRRGWAAAAPTCSRPWALRPAPDRRGLS